MKYAVIGTGACGGVIGGSLLKTGCEVHFLARGDYASIQQEGIKLKCGELWSTLSPVSVYSSIAAMPRCDVIILSAKAYDNPNILPQLRSILTPESIIIILQNGVDIEKEISKLYAAHRQIVTVSLVKATKVTPGNYVHNFGDTIYAASYNRLIHQYCVNSTSIEEIIIADFKKAGFNLLFGTAFFQKQWTKLALNLPLFILTIKYDLSSDKILNNKAYKKELDQLKTEMRNVALASGASLDDEFIDTMYNKLKEVSTYPSMKVDYDDEKQLELEHTFLPVIRRAKKHYIDVSCLIAGYELILEKCAFKENESYQIGKSLSC